MRSKSKLVRGGGEILRGDEKKREVEDAKHRSQQDGPSGACLSTTDQPPPPSYSREARPLAPPVFFHDLSNTTTTASNLLMPSAAPLASQADGLSSQETLAPTPSFPFNFPTGPPPTYAATTRTLTSNAVLAIPQIQPHPTSPFVPAYPSLLRAHGITQETWFSFMQTVSAFLSASPSRRALTQASEVATSVPKQLGRNLMATTTTSARNLGKSAKHLNPFGVIGCTMGFAMGVTGLLVGSVFSSPFVMATATRKPRERVEAYLDKANESWLHMRNLHVALTTMADLAASRDVRVERMQEAADVGIPGGLAGQMLSLSAWVGDMVVDERGEVGRNAVLELDFATLWLVIVPWDRPEDTVSA